MCLLLIFELYFGHADIFRFMPMFLNTVMTSTTRSRTLYLLLLCGLLKEVVIASENNIFCTKHYQQELLPAWMKISRTLHCGLLPKVHNAMLPMLVNIANQNLTSESLIHRLALGWLSVANMADHFKPLLALVRLPSPWLHMANLINSMI